jgi:hypothetical protein
LNITDLVDFSHLANLQYPPQMSTNDFLFCTCDEDTDLYKFWTANNMDSSFMNAQQYSKFLNKEFDFSEKQAPHRVIRGGEGLFGLQSLEESIHPLSFITKKMKFSGEVDDNDEGKDTKRMKKSKYSVSWGDPLKAKYIAAFCVPGKIHIYHGIERDVERMFVI